MTRLVAPALLLLLAAAAAPAAQAQHRRASSLFSRTKQQQPQEGAQEEAAAAEEGGIRFERRALALDETPGFSSVFDKDLQMMKCVGACVCVAGTCMGAAGGGGYRDGGMGWELVDRR